MARAKSASSSGDFQRIKIADDSGRTTEYLRGNEAPPNMKEEIVIDRIFGDVRLFVGEDGVTPRFGQQEVGLPTEFVAHEMSFDLSAGAPSGVAMGWGGSGLKFFYHACK